MSTCPLGAYGAIFSETPRRESVKKKVFSLAAIITLSTVLTACGGEPTATPLPVATNTAAAVAPTATVASGTSGNRKVVVSSKNFTEEFLLGEMYADMLENAGVPVDRKLSPGA